jgi:PAS domain S-box-containing protein
VQTRNLLLDREGNVWVGTIAAGLVRFRPAPLTAYGKQEGLSDSSFSAVFQDREGRIWLGGDSLYWYDGREFHLLPGVANLRAVAQTRDGALWFGGYGGLHRWSSGVLQSIKVEAPAVRAIHEDRQGTLWVGAIMEDRPGGLYRLREDTLVQVPGISDVRDIVEDPGDGGLWVGGLQGLFHLRDGKATLYDQRQGLSSNAVLDIYRDSSGTLWIATYGGGLNRFRNGRFKAITTKEGLPNNTIVQVQEDGKGGLWLASNQDVFRFGLNELNDFLDGKIASILPVSYGIAEGMRSSECNGGSPAGWRTPDGRLWFPTLRGVVAIDPLAGDPIAPPVVLEEARAENWTLARNAPTSVPPGKTTLDFRFTALSFSAPERVRFKYRLEPFDENWVEAGTRRTAHYTNMAPGEYSFHVLAANSYGTWNEQGASTRFTLLPHFYQTNWFRALSTIFVMGLLWAAHLRRVRHLQEQESRFREAINTIPALAFIALPDGSRTFVNRPWVEYTGQTVEQAISDGWQGSVHPEDQERVQGKWRAAVATGELLDFEVRYRRADGEYRWFQVRALPLKDKHGKSIKWCGVAIDIEDRKRAEQLEADLAHVNRVTVLGELAASISHELKQPLTATLTNAKTSLRWLRREQPDLGEATGAIERIVQAGARATEIIDRMRSLYKKTPSQRRLLDVNEVIPEMVVMLRGEANRDAVSIRTHMSGDLPQVMADRIQLQQILMNLMLNGIEAMRDTGGVLTVKSGMDDGRVVISVTDTGVGLPTGETDRIFDAFFTTKPQGSGMGLAISRTIVESHGGRLWATKNGGRGATFHFTLPAAPSHA